MIVFWPFLALLFAALVYPAVVLGWVHERLTRKRTLTPPSEKGFVFLGTIDKY